MRMITTKKLRGTLKKFIVAALVRSGIYLPRRVPMQGKYTPQHISKRRKEQNTISKSVKKTGTRRESVAVNSNILAIFSWAICFRTRRPNIELPIIMHTMKQANINPNGS